MKYWLFIFISAAALTLTRAPVFAQPQTPDVERLIPQVIAELPHDQGAWTQGLLWHEGKLYESTGLNGRSSLRRVDLQTGAVEQFRAVHQAYFAEGLALVGDRLIQLTWQNKTAFSYDLASFGLVRAFTYTGEGWGLCYDGAQLYMSDGSENLFIRDAQTFELIKVLPVMYGEKPITRMEDQPIVSTRPNELECVGDAVYANLYTSNLIARIDKVSGQVTALIDMTALRARALEVYERTDVVNGIAYNPQTETFYVTGKLWPRLFEVRFVSAQP